jgi:hypothetical protein
LDGVRYTHWNGKMPDVGVNAGDDIAVRERPICAPPVSIIRVVGTLRWGRYPQCHPADKKSRLDIRSLNIHFVFYLTIKTVPLFQTICPPS